MYLFHYFDRIPRRCTTKIFFIRKRGRHETGRKDNGFQLFCLPFLLSLSSNYKTLHEIELVVFLFSLYLNKSDGHGNSSTLINAKKSNADDKKLNNIFFHL